eukprot:2842584-Rhodomonas_salina.5
MICCGPFPPSEPTRSCPAMNCATRILPNTGVRNRQPIPRVIARTCMGLTQFDSLRFESGPWFCFSVCS